MADSCEKCGQDLVGETARKRHDGSASELNALLCCHWAETEEGAYWATGCDGAFTIIDGTPKDNGMIYCPYCGKKIAT